ncbi:4Fe-4S dicluster domain-containing protein [bacterium]|nr:4Fe-4S dicluster domain-containing protein [bacterium]
MVDPMEIGTQHQPAGGLHSMSPVRFRTKPQASDDKTYWRSLEELENTPRFQEILEREFPAGASEWQSPLSRRSFLQLMGASMAMAGLVGCRRPEEKIVPYVDAPEGIVYGKPQHYATTMPFGTSAYGALVASFEGRPQKADGNELHPSTLGGSNVFLQASILNLFDPDRSREVRRDGAIKTWDSFVEWWREYGSKFEENEGKGLAVMSEAFSSPTLMRLKNAFLEKYPKADWVSYDAVNDYNVFKGLKLAYGDDLRAEHHFDEAKMILSLDSDFLLMEAESPVNAKSFIKGRKAKGKSTTMSRLYQVEATHSLTGANADHRLRLQSRQIGAFLGAVLMRLRERGGLIVAGAEPWVGAGSESLKGVDEEFIDTVAAELLKWREHALVLAGRRQPPEVHAVCAAINDALGAVNRTVSYRPAKDVSINSPAEFSDWSMRMRKSQFDTVFFLGGNPEYASGEDYGIADHLSRTRHSVHFSSFYDETSQHTEWHIPRSHWLEAWGDARAANGMLSVQQPLIAPLFKTISDVEMFHFIATNERGRGYDIVRDSWRDTVALGENAWQRVLHDGVQAGSEEPVVRPRLSGSNLAAHLREKQPLRFVAEKNNYELIFAADMSMWDGSFANNGWLQEYPDPITKLTWDNAVWMSQPSADEIGCENGEIVEVVYRGQKLDIPAWIVPGHADKSFTLPLGYGRTHAGRVGNGRGYNTYKLRSWTNPNFDIGATIKPTGRKVDLASTQDHWSMEGRALAREARVEQYREKPDFAKYMVHQYNPQSLWDEHQYTEGYQWGMTVDLNACIGCGACAIACQSENNIAVVGKDQVMNGREMAWMRIDRYFKGPVEDAGTIFQPVMCQHCEMAPCEQVCPVVATVHDQEGINAMVYNRCIGTRYCANNCPYKVRRFNFFNFTKRTPWNEGGNGNDYPELVKMTQNPDVTVRSRGVMEKCSFCIQRINRAKQEANVENREVRDGEVKSACQVACPTHAITFGNINDDKSAVSRRKHDPRNYQLLQEVNTRPRTTYLARITNQNQRLEPLEELKLVPQSHGHGGHGGHGKDDAHGHGNGSKGHGDGH